MRSSPAPNLTRLTFVFPCLAGCLRMTLGLLVRYLGLRAAPVPVIWLTTCISTLFLCVCLVYLICLAIASFFLKKNWFRIHQSLFLQDCCVSRCLTVIMFCSGIFISAEIALFAFASAKNSKGNFYITAIGVSQAQLVTSLITDIFFLENCITGAGGPRARPTKKRSTIRHFFPLANRHRALDPKVTVGNTTAVCQPSVSTSFDDPGERERALSPVLLPTPEAPPKQDSSAWYSKCVRSCPDELTLAGWSGVFIGTVILEAYIFSFEPYHGWLVTQWIKGLVAGICSTIGIVLTRRVSTAFASYWAGASILSLVQFIITVISLAITLNVAHDSEPVAIFFPYPLRQSSSALPAVSILFSDSTSSALFILTVLSLIVTVASVQVYGDSGGQCSAYGPLIAGQIWFATVSEIANSIAEGPTQKPGLHSADGDYGDLVNSDLQIYASGFTVLGLFLVTAGAIAMWLGRWNVSSSPSPRARDVDVKTR